MTKTLIAVRKKYGNPELFKLSDDSVISNAEAIELARSGELEGMVVARASSGLEHIRTAPNGIGIDNISELPRF